MTSIDKPSCMPDRDSLPEAITLHFAVGMCLITTFCTRMEEIRFFFEISMLRILLI